MSFQGPDIRCNLKLETGSFVRPVTLGLQVQRAHSRLILWRVCKMAVACVTLPLIA